ncbi:hypothetical protein KC19_4G185300 [Ceratodon purpureus]|uniref:Ion transport domain-containing protein n=1 Tax=Ceratodon purpureus TaxID=3225 RepID=A0A8T0IA79_CERPU|nr:hypothetical protein KC19_4G185300 [Ceratodon purpureus]
MDACQGSLVPLGNVLIFIVMIFSFYALVGVHFYGGKLKSRCTRRSDGQLPFIEEFCGQGGAACDDNTTIVSYMSTFCVKGLVCEGNKTITNGSMGAQICNTIMSFEGWALQMYSTQDSSGLNAEIYYIVMVIIGSYFAVNVCVAAISGVFIRVRHEHQVLLKKHKREQAFTFHNAIKLANVLKDVIKKDDAQLSWFGEMRRKTGLFQRSVSKYIRQGTKKISSMSFRGQSFLKRQFSRGASFGERNSDSELDEDEEDEYGSFKRTKSLKSNKSFSRSLSRSLSTNTRSFKRSMSRNTRRTASTALQIAFIIEMSLRALAHGWKRYFRDVMNILDVIVVVVSFLGISTGDWANISAIRLLRFFHDPRERKFGKSDETPSPLALCLRSFNILGSLGFFFVVVVVVFSIISMELYSGQFASFKNGNPRENHDTFTDAVLTWFTISTGESWINQLWNAMNPSVRYRWVSPYLFIIYFVITTYVLINLIIAVILENTELTDNQKKQIQKREYLKYLRSTHTHAKSLRTGDWLISAVEGTQANVNRIYRNLSVMAPVSKSVKRVNIPLQENDTFPYTDSENISSSPMDALIKSNEHSKEYQTKPIDEDINKKDVPNKIEIDKKTYSTNSLQQGEGQGFRPARLSRPRSSAILHSILEIPEKKKKSSFLQSSATNIKNPLRKERASLDPRLLNRSTTNIATLDATTREAILRRSSYNTLSTPNQSSVTSFINRPRRLSKNATQVFVGAGFANTTTHQDFTEEKTALQSAMLALAHNLSSPIRIQEEEFDSFDRSQESRTSMNNSSRLNTIDEDNAKKVKEENVQTNISSKPKHDLYHSLSIRGSSKRMSFNLEDYEGLNIKYREVPWYFSDKSLFIFRSNGPTRKFLVIFVENIWYKRFIMICAIVAVYIVTQLNPAGFIDSTYVDLMDRFLLFTWTWDVLIKSIAYGVIFTPEAYLGDPFNIIDVVNMFFQWVGFNPPSESYSRIVHIMNTIRGTRFIPRIHGLRILVSTMLHTMPAVASMFGFILVIYFIFATIGVQMFRNRFASCTDLSVKNRAECVGTFVNEVGLRTQRTWMNPPLHFDWFGAGMLSLFVCSTTDAWINYFLHTAEDIPDTLYDNPVTKNKISNSIYFIVFIIISNWLVIRLLIGVFIDQFGIISGSKLLTERQKLWRDMNRIAQSLKPKKLPQIPKNPTRRMCYKLVHDSTTFRYAMVTIILVNYCLIASQRWDGNSTHTLQSVEVGFVVIYWIEAGLKLLGNHFYDWKKDWWNIIEFILVLGSTCCLYPKVDSSADQLGTMFRFIQYEVYNFHVYNKGIPFRNLLETLVLYKIGSQGLILALRIEREKQLRQIFKVGATIVIQSHIRRYLVQKGFIVSHPLEYFDVVEEESNEYDDELEDSGERFKKKIMGRFKIFLITGK